MAVPQRKSSNLMVASFIHGTTTLKAAVPSHAFDNCVSSSVVNSTSAFCIPDTSIAPGALLGAMSAASMGYVGIVPDGIGYGASSAVPSSYLVAQGYAIDTFNLHAAAVLLVPTLQQNAGVGSQIITAGYSEGGYGALAIHRESYSAEWAEADVSVIASFPSAGPYDLSQELINTVTETVETSRPSYVLYLGWAYYAKGFQIFSADYLSTIQVWFDGSYSAYQIDSGISTTFGDSFLNAFDATFLAAIRVGETTAFGTVLEENSLVEDWKPQSSMVRLCHGTADEVVPYSNAEHLLTAMQAASADISLQTYNSGDCNSHTDCAPNCLVHTLKSMWEYEGKWKGALNNDGGVATATIVAAVLGITVVLAIGFFVYRKVKDGTNYDMIA